MSVNAILAMDNNMSIVPNVPFNKNLATMFEQLKREGHISEYNLEEKWFRCFTTESIVRKRLK